MDGFVTFSETTDAMNDLKVEVFDCELAWGFYRWPTAWPISWTGSHGPAVLVLKQLTRTSVDNWAIGGFSMAVVQDELSLAGKQQEVYGLVELIMQSIFRREMRHYSLWCGAADAVGMEAEIHPSMNSTLHCHEAAAALTRVMTSAAFVVPVVMSTRTWFGTRLK